MSAPLSSTHFRNVKNTAVNLSNGLIDVTSLLVVNTTAAAIFVQFFNLAAADVVVGTTRPVFSIPVAATTGFEVVYFGPNGTIFDTRLSAAATTTVEGSTDPGDGVFVQIFIT